MVDESHRTQVGELHKAMKSGFTKWVYIWAFTGTPVLKSEKSLLRKVSEGEIPGIIPFG